MKDNVYDIAVEKALKRVDTVAEAISKKFKGVKPFDKTPIPKNELLGYYEGLGMEDMVWLIQRHGEDVVGEFIRDMETLKAKEVGYGRP